MTLINTQQKFGALTKILHWSIFCLFVLQYFLVYRREYFPKDSPEKLQYLLLHKSVGACLLILALFMIFWRHLGIRPKMPTHMNSLEILAAKFTHFLLYATMLWMPISGLCMSMFAGYSVALFGWVTLPNPFTKNEALGHFFYTSHVWCSYLIIGLVSLHVLAALYHHFWKRDEILTRMLPSGL